MIFVPARTLLQNAPAYRKYRENLIEVSLWENLSRKEIMDSLQSASARNRQRQWIRKIFGQIQEAGFRHIILCIAQNLLGTDLRFEKPVGHWLREISRDILKIAPFPVAIAHQPSTLDEVESCGRIKSIHILDLTTFIRTNPTPEKAFRWVTSFLRFDKPIVFSLHHNHLNRRIKKEAQADNLRKLVWSSFLAGAWGISSNLHPPLIQKLEREKSVFTEFSSHFKSIGKPYFPFTLVKSGKYTSRKISAKEYFLYSPYGGKITIDCSKLRLPALLRWFNPKTGKFTRNDISLWDRDLVLKAPFEGDAAIYLRQK